MKSRTSLLARLLTAAALSAGCKSAKVVQNNSDPVHVYVRASEIGAVDRRRMDPIWQHDAKVFLNLYLSKEAQQRLRLVETPCQMGMQSTSPVAGS